MTLLEFMGEHPFLTVIVLWLICQTIVNLVKIFLEKCDDGEP